MGIKARIRGSVRKSDVRSKIRRHSRTLLNRRLLFLAPICLGLVILLTLARAGGMPPTSPPASLRPTAGISATTQPAAGSTSHPTPSPAVRVARRLHVDDDLVEHAYWWPTTTTRAMPV